MADTTKPADAAPADAVPVDPVDLVDRTILVTGVTGQVGRPLAIALARSNTVYGAARFKDTALRDELTAAGVRCAPVDLVSADVAQLPERVEFVLNFGVVKSNRWSVDLDGNTGGTLALAERYAGIATAFLHCSSGAVYAPDHDGLLGEDHDLGDSHAVWPFLHTYSICKIAAETAARYAARRYNLPTTIARLNVPYGPTAGGLPDYHLQMMAAGMPVPVFGASEADSTPTRYQLLHDDDTVAMIPGLLAVAGVPATVLNWAGPETVSVQEWCAELTALTGLPATFDYTEATLGSVVMDLTSLHERVGAARVPWKEGLRAMVAARHPHLARAGTDAPSPIG
ncbi:NAD-dependent epimerase/dehydratase family protein [Frankia sp. AgB1.9]|uniref:NAD-dependent epimerase/dehydratase family protein n=1 Tax=unclassified Frankia TaxID=2632575 RepID=UPI00193153F2|nr:MULTISPECIES: NAD-dependent epimerase/dehydratase family protein [unclassified Frankia]MBL7489533.1 NAD-dependent epimerase/dehydratase family protein [Frankia sp. AgW1.1]MBL7547888.1 NAD-dependent epimerase/dehydratase family protein [Frankia sp. AgB1.9]MBL7621388.1 NAD-dependent epimerase/dehydratase family protein [Frankia sp. AgB1.8]